MDTMNRPTRIWLLVIAGCTSANVQHSRDDRMPAAPVPSADTVRRPIEIYHDGAHGLGAIRAVIQTPLELDRIWVVLRRAKEQPAPVVDFSKEMLVVAGLGWEPGSGYGIRIASARDTARVLEVLVDVMINDCNVSYSMIDHPTVIVRVPRTQSTAVFRDRVHRRNC